MTKLRTPRAKFRARALAALLLALLALDPLRAQQPSSGPLEADRLHVVLLVFGHKGGISAACQKDCKGVKTALEAAFVDEEERLVIHDLSAKNPATGKPYTKNETLEVIKKLDVSGNDNVLVFQSGHGSIGNATEPELSHRLVMDGGTLTRAQIQSPIEALKPRGIIFLTDCCSGISKKPGKVSQEELVRVAEPNVLTIRNLLLRARGVVSITAAEDGKLAIAGYKGANPGKAGSAFTVALLRLWYSEVTYDNWGQFFPPLKAETKLASGGKHSARAFQLNDPSAINLVWPRLETPRLDVFRWGW